VKRRRREAGRALASADDWITPPWLDTEDGPVTTPVGSLDSTRRAWVDDHGLVSLPGWSLDWWIGAEDRWHVPSRELAVRQRLVDGAPVVETAMRVPGGDVVQRVFGAVLGTTDALVVEIENATPTPVVLAMAVRPYTTTGRAPVGRIDLEGSTVTVDGAVGLLASKPPSRVATSNGRSGDVATVVLGGAAGETASPAVCADGAATAAYLWPLTHRTTMRFVVPLDGSRTLGGTIPSADQVARGWKVHADRGARLVLPDPQLQSALDAVRRLLLLDDSRPARRAASLARVGLPDEAAEVLRRIEVADAGPDLLEAAAWHWRLFRDLQLARDLAEVVAFAADRAARHGVDAGVLDGAADVLHAAGEEQAARVARRAAATAPTGWHDIAPTAELQALLAAASPTWRWPDEGAHRFLDLLLGGVATAGPDRTLRVASWFPWLGQGIEVHDLPTPLGRLSYAVRWHGDRPALLWELDAHDDEAVTLTAPGLDPAWSSAERRGDALLQPVVEGTAVRLGGRRHR
jgi:hypothetical protein